MEAAEQGVITTLQNSRIARSITVISMSLSFIQAVVLRISLGIVSETRQLEYISSTVIANIIS